MSNLSENRINVVLSAADITAINTSIAAILSKVPANTTLTDEQRTGYRAIDVDNKVFSEDCLVEAQNNGTGIIPSFVSLTNLQNDLAIFEQLDTIYSSLKNVVQRIEDARRIAGHEAYGQANVIYKAFANAHESGVPNATAPYTKLKARYDAQRLPSGRNTNDTP